MFCWLSWEFVSFTDPSIMLCWMSIAFSLKLFYPTFLLQFSGCYIQVTICLRKILFEVSKYQWDTLIYVETLVMLGYQCTHNHYLDFDVIYNINISYYQLIKNMIL